MIRAFLFDIGNVLVGFDFTRAAQAVLAETDAANLPELFARLEPVKVPYEAGHSSSMEFLAAARQALGYRGSDCAFIAAWQGIFWANTLMHDFVAQVAGKYPLYLLSNTNEIHVAGLFRDYPVFQHFSGATYSHVARASKPEADIYQIAIASHGLDPAATFFIDDLAPNIEMAKSLGFQTHRYDLKNHQAFLDEVLPLIAVE